MKPISDCVPTTTPRRPSEAAVPAMRQKIRSSRRCSQGRLPLSIPAKAVVATAAVAPSIVPIGGTIGPSPARQATPESIAPTPIVTAAGGEPAAVPRASIAATGMAATSPARTDIRARSKLPASRNAWPTASDLPALALGSRTPLTRRMDSGCTGRADRRAPAFRSRRRWKTTTWRRGRRQAPIADAR